MIFVTVGTHEQPFNRLVQKIDELKKDGVIIIETDEKERELKNLTQIEAEIFDIRKYGRANLIFLKRKE